MNYKGYPAEITHSKRDGSEHEIKITDGFGDERYLYVPAADLTERFPRYRITTAAGEIKSADTPKQAIAAAGRGSVIEVCAPSAGEYKVVKLETLVDFEESCRKQSAENFKKIFGI